LRSVGNFILFSRNYLLCFACLFISVSCFAQRTSVSGRVIDAETGQPVARVSVTFTNTHIGTSTDSLGRFNLSASGSFLHITVSAIGYQTTEKAIAPATSNQIQIKLAKSQTVLKEVSVRGRNKPYRNKGNPAVDLIRRIIANKDSNRAQNAAYLQYDQYERVGLTMFSIPPFLLNTFLFKPYRFMIDTVNGKLSADVYLSEKRFKNYSRRDPEKSIQILEARKESNIIKFIDTAGLNIYINRLYGNTIDIYQNNVYVINRQFLSPIADHSPDFYKFFITDTIKTGKDTLVELSFVPRNKGDILFEGRLLVTLDGRYAVTYCELNINGQINLNFLRTMNIGLNFQKQPSGRYFLTKSDVKADFGILKNKGFGVLGERAVYYSNYVANSPKEPAFYKGKDEQTLPDPDLRDSTYWQEQRTDTLAKRQMLFYRNVAKLEQMRSFKRATWLTATLTTGYADAGIFQFNLNNIYSFSSLEGSRFAIGGRTTPKFNKTIYLEGYLAYGTRDNKFKDNTNLYYSFNKTPFYRFPNNYLKIGQQYDIAQPGSNFSSGNFRSPLSSFQSGTNSYYFYAHTYKIDYVKEFDNHFSFDIGFNRRDQQATGALSYTMNDAQHTPVNQIITSVAALSLRYAPHEQIYQTTNDRLVVHNKYPIYTLQVNQGLNGVFNGGYKFTSFTGSIVKRLFMSQLGYADITLLGNQTFGKVPFPLLNIAPANQAIIYDPDAYNLMHYLEFVSDHYVGFNYTQSFKGFFLNKVPLIKHLKWREYLSFKALYGGLRAENDPKVSSGLFDFPVAAAGATGTYPLGDSPYLEGGVGIGNIFKVLRIDGIRRFNYLDNPGASKYGVKFTVDIAL
jgi:hypothetical protein